MSNSSQFVPNSRLPLAASPGTRASVDLNAIRGAAALVVLLGHTRSLFFSSLSAAGHPLAMSQSGGPGPLTVGNEAVIVFFVLSGYLIGGSVLKDLRKATFTWKKYLTMRLTRLWVVLLPALLFGVALDRLGLRMFSGPRSIYSGPLGLCIIPCDLASRVSLKVVAANALFLQERFFPTAGSNNALWSLTNEFWYYLAFPLCLLALRAGELVSRRIVYATLLLAVVAVMGKDIFLLFFVWLLGVLLSMLPLKMPSYLLRFSTCSVGLIFLFTLMAVRRASLSRFLAEAIIGLSFSALLYLVLHRTELARANLYKRVADFLSRISYSLYLVHLPLAIFLCACINTPWRHWEKTPAHMACFLLFNLVVVAFTYLFYLAFEANTNRVRRLVVSWQSPYFPARRVPAQAEPIAPSVSSQIAVRSDISCRI